MNAPCSTRCNSMKIARELQHLSEPSVPRGLPLDPQLVPRCAPQHADLSPKGFNKCLSQRSARGWSNTMPSISKASQIKQKKNNIQYNFNQFNTPKDTNIYTHTHTLKNNLVEQQKRGSRNARLRCCSLGPMASQQQSGPTDQRSQNGKTPSLLILMCHIKCSGNRRKQGFPTYACDVGRI